MDGRTHFEVLEQLVEGSGETSTEGRSEPVDPVVPRKRTSNDSGSERPGLQARCQKKVGQNVGKRENG